MINKYWRWLPLISGLLAAGMVLKRELWFDEALTLINFVLGKNPWEIYNSYFIPNNQIIYSIMLNIWDFLYCGLPDITVYWRILSLGCALGMLAILLHIRQKIDHGRFFPAVLVLTAMTISMPFVNYATALRGYGASWLFGAMALWGLYQITCEKKHSGWLLYGAGVLLAAGTVPTNLLLLAAVLVYALEWLDKPFWRDRRFYIAGGILLILPVIFYGFIANDFLNTFKLGEGFRSCGGAIAVTAGMYASCFGLLLIFIFADIFSVRKSPGGYLRYTIWFFPAAPILLLHAVPFPRVFVTLLPVLAMLLIDQIAWCTQKNWRHAQLTILFLLAVCTQLLLIPCGWQAVKKLHLSRYEDDFFLPWYMYPGYQISQTAETVRNFPEYKTVFLSFSSDPASILFYLNKTMPLAVDLPNNSVRSLNKGAVLVLRKDEDPASVGERFGGQLRKLSENKLHSFYELY